MYYILITPDRAGRRVGEVHISRRTHDEMLHELLIHPTRPLSPQVVSCCVKEHAVSEVDAHEIALVMADAFWICWCDDPSQYRR